MYMYVYTHAYMHIYACGVCIFINVCIHAYICMRCVYLFINVWGEPMMLFLIRCLFLFHSCICIFI